MMLKLKLQYFGHLMQRVGSLKRLWCWEGLGAGGEGDARGWDGWMASLIRWTWVWVNSGSLWWTRRPGVLRFMGSQRVGHDWVTELNWKEQDKCLPNQTKEEEIGNLPDKEFRIMILKMIQKLEIKMESQINSLETRIEKMQERFNKDLEEIKKSQYIMNNAINEIENSGGNN